VPKPTPPDDGPRRASRRDTLAVWLRLYTVHRDVEVPPLPVRRVAAVAVALLAGIAVGIALLVSAGSSSKERERRRESAADAAALRRERQRVMADQRAHVVTARVGGRSVAARAALVDRAERAIGADARARARRGRLHGPIRTVTCSPLPAGTTVHPERRLDLRTGVYDCTAVTADIPASRLNSAGAVGYPFRLAVDFRAGRFGWCMVDPPPGEGSAPDPRRVVRPPAACTDPRSLAP
jgi:hypothetical protein